MNIFYVLQSIGRTFFPSFCVSCGAERVENEKHSQEQWLCSACRSLLVSFPHTICPSCNARTIDGRLENSCVQKSGLTRFFCAYPLQQKPLQALVYTYKYRHGATLRNHLSGMLMKWIADKRLRDAFEKTSRLVFIPIPLHEERKRQRGFNQAAFLAQDLAHAFRLPCQEATLVRVKQTPSQLVARTKEAREKNMEHAFAVKNKKSVVGLRVVLVDDVYTTGATMKHAALVLREAGAREVWGITVAKG